MEKGKYAKECVPSMKRRMEGNDYYGRQIYMITIAVEDREPLLGTLVGHYEAPLVSPDAPRVVLSPLGEKVKEELESLAQRDGVSVIAYQIMPDHLHFIIFVHSALTEHLGKLISLLKVRCNKWLQQLCPQEYGRRLRLQQAMTEGRENRSCRPRHASAYTTDSAHYGSENRKRGLLFETGYNDKLLLRNGQLRRMIDYLADNPRRLALKRVFPDYFAHCQYANICGLSFVAVGNRDLLTHDLKAVHCRRHWNEEEVETYKRQCLEEGKKGMVLISPFISREEKEVMQQAIEMGLSIIEIRGNGFGKLEKPSGKMFDLCAEGRLLMLAPMGWPHKNGRYTVTRAVCQQLNAMAEQLANGSVGRGMPRLTEQ